MIKELKQLREKKSGTPPPGGFSSPSAAADIPVVAAPAFTTKAQRLLQLCQDDQQMISELKQKHEELQGIVEQKNEKIESLQRNYVNISNMLQNEKENSKERENLIRDLEKQILLFKEKISQVGTKDIEFSQLSKQYDLLVDRNNHLESIFSEKNNEIESLQDRVLLLEDEITNLKSDVLEAKKKMVEAEKQKGELDIKLEKNQKDFLETKQKLEKTLTNHDQEKTEKENFKNATKILTQKISTLEIENQDLKEKQSNFQTQKIKYEAELINLKNQSQQSELLLQQTKKSFSISEIELKRLTLEIEKSQKKNLDLGRDLESLRSELSKKQNLIISYITRDDEFSKKLSVSKEENSNLLKELEKMKVELDRKAEKESSENLEKMKSSNYLKALKETLLDKKRELEEEIRKNGDLSREISDIEIELAEKKAENSKIRSELEIALDKIGNYESEISQISDIEKRNMERLLGKERKLSIELERLTEILSEKNSALLCVEKKNEQFIREISDANNTITFLKTEILKKSEIIENLQENLSKASEDSKKSSENSKSETFNLEERYKKIMDENSEMQRSIDVANLKLKDMERLTNEQEASISNLEFEKSNLESNLQKLEHNLLENSEKSSISKSMLEEAQKKEKKLAFAIKKLIDTEDAAESALTCTQCMNIFTNPITCFPCGHVFCQKCFDKFNKEHSITEKNSCCECRKDVSKTIASDSIELLASKQSLKKQTLSSLLALTKGMINQSSSS